jgi:hypothetical protein
VFVGAQAIAEGFLTRDQLYNGPFVRVLHGVYADTSVPRDHLLRCRAAMLLMPPQAALGGRSAAAVLGAPAPGYLDPVTVVLPPEHHWTGPRGVRVHQAPLPASDVVSGEDGLRHTTALRTARDVAALESIATAVGILDAMLHRGLVQPAELAALARSHPRRWRAQRVRRVLELVDGRAESPPESWVRVACVLADLPHPVPQLRIWSDGRYLGRADLAWPEHRLIVEYEGEYHFADGQIVRDDVRIASFVAAGWRVIRLAAHDLRDMDGVVRRIAEALDHPVAAA